MERERRIVGEVLASTSLAVAGEIITGTILISWREFFRLIPGLLVLVPVALDLRGCISSTFAARLGTGIHLGLVGRELGFNDELKQNIFAVFAQASIVGPFMGILAYALLRALKMPSASLLALVFISTVGSVLAACIQTWITIAIAFLSAEKGLDPDNVTIPLCTMMGDFVAGGSLVIAAKLWLLMGIAGL